jgi:hypothetical protein
MATLVRLATLSMLVRLATLSTLSTLVRLASPSMLVQMQALPPVGRLENGFRSCTPRALPTMRGSAGPLPSDAMRRHVGWPDRRWWHTARLVQLFLGCLAVYGYPPL